MYIHFLYKCLILFAKYRSIWAKYTWILYIFAHIHIYLYVYLSMFQKIEKCRQINSSTLNKMNKKWNLASVINGFSHKMSTYQIYFKPIQNTNTTHTQHATLTHITYFLFILKEKKKKHKISKRNYKL